MVSNTPLEWTGHHRFAACIFESLPATQGQRQPFVLRSRPILLTLPYWSIQLASPIVLLDLWLTGSKSTVICKVDD
jgi:hypothetical protein